MVVSAIISLLGILLGSASCSMGVPLKQMAGAQYRSCCPTSDRERETSAVHCDSAFNISATLHPAGEGFFFFCYIKLLICGHQGLPVFSCHNCDRQTNRLKVAIVHREAKYKKGVFYEQFERALYYCFFLANAEAQVLPLAKALEHGHFQGLWLIT